MRNGYFQLDRRVDGTYLILYPPIEDGIPCDPLEITKYLDDFKIDYDKNQIYDQVKDQTKEKAFRINTVKIASIDETANVTLLEDGLKAQVRFYPTIVGGREFSHEDVVHQLTVKGIKFGIDDVAIDKYIKNKKFCTNYILAEAMLPIEGSDAVIEYHFNTDPSRKPKMNEDGSVDFHKLDNLSHIQKDEVIATLTPAVMGKPGTDVLGRVLKPKKVNVKFLRKVKNTRLAPNGLDLVSEVNGHASLVDGQIFVSDIYVIPGNVDASTGDIEYEGNVEVNGNVNTGYKVTASGDIIVNGIVEGAEIHAGGQIILKRGIQGMSRGVLDAGSNIVAKFIESAEVHAGGYIQTESIMHSKVQAGAEVKVSGRKGFITGGVIKAGRCVEAKIIGSVMGTATEIAVGENIALSEEVKQLSNERIQVTDNLDKSEKIIAFISKKMRDGEALAPEKIEQFKTLAAKTTDMKHRIEEIDKRIDYLCEQIDSFVNGYIAVDDVIYPGCKVMVSNVTTFIHAETKHCKLIRDGADVRVKAY